MSAVRTPAVLLLIAGLLGACANGEGPPQSNNDAVAIPYQLVAQGPHSGIATRQFVVVDRAEQWRSLWQDHRGSRNARAPDINFDRYRLVAIFMGEQRSGGYSIDVQRIEKRDEAVWIKLREQTPAPDQMVTMALTQPFVMVKIPRIQAPIRLETGTDK